MFYTASGSSPAGGRALSGENSKTPSSSPVQLAMVEGMVTDAALSESAKILSRYARRTAPASLSGGEATWGRFSGLRGWGKMQIARHALICVRATGSPRCSGFTINHIDGIMCPPSPAALL